MSDQFSIEWEDHHKEPQCLPDLRYPNGIDIIVSSGLPACKVDLPYPAKRCGFYRVHCRKCNHIVIVTTAGRMDDPRSVTIPCNK